MIPRSHLITLDQVIIGICKTTNSLIVRVVCNVGLTVRTSPPPRQLPSRPMKEGKLH